MNVLSSPVVPIFKLMRKRKKNWRISPPEKQTLKQGDLFSFRIILWDRNVDYGLNIIKVMEFFKTDCLSLVEVKNFDEVIYENRNILSGIKTKNIRDVIVPRKEFTPMKFVLNLRTPLRIKKRKRLVTGIDENNMTEVFSLNSMEGIEYEKIFERWIDFKRFSHRQKTSMRMGGLIGKYHFTDRKGELSASLSRAGVLGLGKARTFGFGDMTVDENI